MKNIFFIVIIILSINAHAGELNNMNSSEFVFSLLNLPQPNDTEVGKSPKATYFDSKSGSFVLKHFHGKVIGRLLCQNEKLNQEARNVFEGAFVTHVSVSPEMVVIGTYKGGQAYKTDIKPISCVYLSK